MASASLIYRGFVINRGRTYQDYQTYFPATRRARWGTLKEICADIDLILSGHSLMPPMRGGN